MFDRRLRKFKERIFLPTATEVGKCVHPTALSLISLGIGLAAGIAGWQGAYPLGLTLWLMNRILDGLDGTVARLHNSRSDLGAYIDILVDQIIYALIPAMLALSQPSQAAFVAALFLISTFFVNASSWMYLAAILERRQQGAVLHGEYTAITMPDGLIEGAETIVFYSLFFLLPGVIVPLFAVMGALVLVTVIQRIVWAVRHL